MKTHTSIATLLAASLLAFAAHAAAQTAQTKPGATAQGPTPMKHGDMQMPRTPEERAKMANAMFDRIDANKDGSLSRAEFVEHHKAMSMDHGMGMGHDGHGMDHRGMDAHGMDDHGMGHHGMDHQRGGHQGMPGGAAPKKAFADWDANKDGKLSREEMAKHPMANHFGMMDANKDGFLSPKELSSHGE